MRRLVFERMSDDLIERQLTRHESIYKASVDYMYAIGRNVPEGAKRTEAFAKVSEAMAAANEAILSEFLGAEE